jgi:hypothetical protein
LPEVGTMTDETRDPRLGAMREILHGWDPLDAPPSPEECRESLALLDAADPIRQVWAEVVEADDELRAAVLHFTTSPSDPESGEARPEPMDEHQMAHLIGVGCENDVPHDDLCDAFLNLYARLQPRTVSREQFEALRQVLIRDYGDSEKGATDTAYEIVTEVLGLTIQPEESP